MAAKSPPTATHLGSIKELRTIFQKFDRNGDGKISCSELKDSLRETGMQVSAEGVQCMLKDFDRDGNGYIDFDEFVDLIQRGRLDEQGGGSPGQELKDAFDLYDTDRDGVISVNELHAVMKAQGFKSTRADCMKMIRQVDQDGDGRVNFQEFKKMMTGELKS